MRRQKLEPEKTEIRAKEEERDREIRSLKESVKSLQITKRGEGLGYEDLCVHPDIDLPTGYKPPKFDIFDGTGNP